MGAWLTILTAAALGFASAGAFGVSAFVDSSQMSGIHALTGDGGLASRPAVLLYAAVLAAAVAGLFVPQDKLSGRAALRVALGASIVVVGLAIALVFTVSAILAVVVGLGVGATFAAVLSLIVNTRVKPWRSAGVAAAVMVFTTYAAQLLGGVSGGHGAIRWLLLLGSLVMTAGVVVLLVKTPDGGVHLPDTGAHVLDRAGIARPGAQVTSAWPCHLLFAVLGAVGVLAQPTVADLGFGQAGMSVILCAVLLGWAVGFETGPDFAPGMTRTRLTSFALIAAGVLTVSTGVLTELSGTAILSGGVAFLVGLGVRAQRYHFSRRIGAIVGMAAAVIITAVGFTAELPLSAYASWDIHPAGLSYVLIGAIALIAGVISLFTFGPTGIHGIGVDVVHAFRVPQAAGRRAAAAGTGPGEAGAQHAGAPDTGAQDIGAQDTGRGTGAAPEALGAAEAPGSADAVAHGDPAAVAATTLASALGADAAPSGSPDSPSGSRGLFVAIEGGDGTGKSTQIHLLADALRDRGHAEVVTTREPGGTEAGRMLRSVVLDGDGVTPRAEALVFAADRAHHVASLIRPIVARGGIVITDRYIDSSRAYQAAGRELGDDEIVALSTWATEGLRPDLTIVLDANPAVTRQRTSSRGDENHLDALDHFFHTTVRQSFLAFAAASPDRYVVIDAGRDIDTIADAVLQAVEDHLAGAAKEDSQQDSFSGPLQPAGPSPVASSHTAGPTAGGAAPAGAPVVADDAPTVVHRVPAEAGSEDETRAVRRAAPATDEGSEGETRVVRRAEADAPHGSAPHVPAPHASAPHSSSPQGSPPHPGYAPPPPPPVVDTSEAPTTVQSAVPPQRDVTTAARQTSRERLRAQAEIERQARERLRAQRGHDRGPDHGGPVPR
ncbi:hypothetical protein GCM10023159_24650 [Brevibacterium yomogidense]